MQLKSGDKHVFAGEWENNFGKKGLFELEYIVPNEGFVPQQDKKRYKQQVFIRNQDAPGAKVSDIKADGEFYINYLGIPMVEFHFFDVHAICTIGQIGHLQGTFVSRRDHGTYIAQCKEGDQSLFSSYLGPFVRRVQSLQPCKINQLMQIIHSDMANAPDHFMETGDVSMYEWMPEERRKIMKWRPWNAKGAPQISCSETYTVGTTPVHYPNGWIRFGLPRPAKKVHGLLYHGTHPDNVLKILSSGLKPGVAGEGIPKQAYSKGVRAVYLTPSLEYAAVPRYAKELESNGYSEVFQTNDVYVQLVLEVSTFQKPDKVQAETLGVGREIGGWATRPWGQSGCVSQTVGDVPYPRNHKVIDPNFGNNYNLEHLYYIKDMANWLPDSKSKLQVTGILIRVTDENPKETYQKRKNQTPVTSH